MIIMTGKVISFGQETIASEMLRLGYREDPMLFADSVFGYFMDGNYDGLSFPFTNEGGYCIGSLWFQRSVLMSEPIYKVRLIDNERNAILDWGVIR